MKMNRVFLQASTRKALVILFDETQDSFLTLGGAAVLVTAREYGGIKGKKYLFSRLQRVLLFHFFLELAKYNMRILWKSCILKIFNTFINCNYDIIILIYTIYH